MKYVFSDHGLNQGPYANTEDRNSLYCWSAVLVVGFLFAWPLVFAAWIQGPKIFIHCLTGDAYEYLAVARKALQYGIYTYDGVHVTNGFHPLWEYFLRFVFAAGGITSHEQQAIASITCALIAATTGVMLTAKSIIRFTRSPMLAVLLVPGVYYLVVGVHVRNLWIWTSLDGMESAFSTLFGGLLFYVSSNIITNTRHAGNRAVRFSKAIGLILPFLILSRLDDFFIIPALAIAIFCTDISPREKVKSVLWLGAPSTITIVAYLVYNHITAQSAMPLSGMTKAGFVGFLTTYFIAAVHFPPVFEIKALITGRASDSTGILSNSFRFIEVFYPMMAGIFSSLIVWRHGRNRNDAFFLFGIALYVVFKAAYNYLNVHSWHQSDWYYMLSTLSLSVLGAIALSVIWSGLRNKPIVRYFAGFLLIGLALITSSQFYGSIAYSKSTTAPMGYEKFWATSNALRAELVKQGVTGIVNFDDGITAFLLDLPALHGFALATDPEAQRAATNGNLLSLAYRRKINAIIGFGYLHASTLSDNDEEIRAFIKRSVAFEAVRNDLNRFSFFLIAYDARTQLPVIGFRPRMDSSR